MSGDVTVRFIDVSDERRRFKVISIPKHTPFPACIKYVAEAFGMAPEGILLLRKAGYPVCNGIIEQRSASEIITDYEDLYIVPRDRATDAYPPGNGDPNKGDGSGATWQFTDPVYSLPLLPPSDDASTSIYRNVVCKNSLVSTPMLSPDMTTLPSLLELSRMLHGDRPFLGARHGDVYWFMSYRDFYTQANRLASGIQQLGVCQKAAFDDEPYRLFFRMAGIYGHGCINWILTEFACHILGITVVPLQEDLPSPMLSYMISDTRMPLLFVTRDHLEAALKCSNSAHVKCLVVIDVDNRREIDPSFLAQAEAMDLMVMALGQGRPFSPYPTTPSDVALLQYTGGSIGDPMGVMVTHSNCIATLAALSEYREGGGSPPPLQLGSQDCIASTLPITDPLYRTIIYLGMYHGSCLGFVSNCHPGGALSDTLVKSDLSLLHPTVVLAEPGYLSTLPVKAHTISFCHQNAYPIPFSPRLQGRIDFPGYFRDGCGRDQRAHFETFICEGQSVGSRRPSSTDCQRWSDPTHWTSSPLKKCGGIALLTSPRDYRCGLVGGPIASLDMRLVDASHSSSIGDCSVAHVDAQTCELRPRGELCVRGNSVSPGYFRRPQATLQRFDPGGWFHTGDVVEVLPAGAVKLFDERICEQLDVGDGRMVSASRIEHAYETHCSGIDQCVAFGSSKAEAIIALIVPCVRAAKLWAAEAEILFHVDELLESDWLRARIMREMDELSTDILPKGHKYRVSEVELVKEPFSVACGTITAGVARRYRRSEIMLQNRDKIEAALRRLPLLRPMKHGYHSITELVTPRRISLKYGDNIFTGSTAFCSESRRQSTSTPETQTYDEDEPRDRSFTHSVVHPPFANTSLIVIRMLLGLALSACVFAQGGFTSHPPDNTRSTEEVNALLDDVDEVLKRQSAFERSCITISPEFKRDIAAFFAPLPGAREWTVLEVGIYHGYTTAVLSKIFKHVIVLEYYLGNVFTAMDNVKMFAGNTSNIEWHSFDAYSTSWASTLMPANPVEVVLIDASHTYDHVHSDILNALALPDVRWLIMDDYGIFQKGQLEVRHALRYFEDAGTLNCSWPVGNGEIFFANITDFFTVGREGLICMVIGPPPHLGTTIGLVVDRVLTGVHASTFQLFDTYRYNPYDTLNFKRVTNPLPRNASYAQIFSDNLGLATVVQWHNNRLVLEFEQDIVKWEVEFNPTLTGVTVTEHPLGAVYRGIRLFGIFTRIESAAHEDVIIP
ncbi:hypothetical protein FOL47_005080 [Perkinsus chesapeaki]|uniref:Ubiquitin-fold modifier 1 n=1 Tax=Perkinsus chesapeaki TaxID=330153 RepID=A0A7J6LZ71_PERCH|nr:hypothetical protein FOL47_005080 [Perkinsus chesapeaki]